jgi:hypothetical protein
MGNARNSDRKPLKILFRHIFLGHRLKKTSPHTDEVVMTTQTPEVTHEEMPTNTTEVPESVIASTEAAAEPTSPVAAAEIPTEQNASAEPPSEPKVTQEPDGIQPFIDKACETIQHEVEATELGKFLRAHIKTFREEWDVWPDSAKDTYAHMMTSQLVQRKAAATRIKIYDAFKLPVPSAQTTLFESLKRSQIKPQKRQPVLLVPPNLRPTYSLK